MKHVGHQRGPSGSGGTEVAGPGGGVAGAARGAGVGVGLGSRGRSAVAWGHGPVRAGARRPQGGVLVDKLCFFSPGAVRSHVRPAANQRTKGQDNKGERSRYGSRGPGRRGPRAEGAALAETRCTCIGGREVSKAAARTAEFSSLSLRERKLRNLILGETKQVENRDFSRSK